MILNLPLFISIVFGLITLATIYLFNRVVLNSPLPATQKKANPIIVGSLVWLLVQGALAFSGVYSNSPGSMPPKLFLFGFFPVIILFLYIFLTKSGREFADSLPLKQLASLNVIRLAVELGLFVLYLYHCIPRLMTFEGGNLDIISGLSAPIVVYFMFTKRTMKPGLFLAWHFLCLILLFNIVSRALLSAPFPFQKMGFEQPNIAILYFPFVWLPVFIVTTVLFGHITSIRKLIRKDLS